MKSLEYQITVNCVVLRTLANIWILYRYYLCISDIKWIFIYCLWIITDYMTRCYKYQRYNNSNISNLICFGPRHIFIRPECLYVSSWVMPEAKVSFSLYHLRKINVRENRTANQDWTIQRNWQDCVHKTQNKDKQNKKYSIEILL